MLQHLGRKIIIVIFTLSLLCGLPLPARSQPAQARELPADLPPLIEPLFATGGAVTAVSVSGNLAFVVEGGQFLALDVSAPDHILQVGSVYMPGLASGSKVELSGDIAYVLSDKLGLVLIDVSDPSAPWVRGSYLGPGPHIPFSSPSDIALQGSYAYLAIPYHGLQILDVSDPEFPTLVGSINQDHHHPMVEVAGSTIYLLTYSLDIYDATNPAAPLRTSSTFVGDAHDLKINGNYAYVSEVIDGTWGKYGGTPGQETLFVLDISDLQRPTLAGSLEFVILTSTGSMQIQDGQLYLDADGSLMLIDIEVPNNPIILSELPVSFANGVIANGRIYYLEYFVLNIGELQNPDPPVKVGEFGSLNFPDLNFFL